MSAKIFASLSRTSGNAQVYEQKENENAVVDFDQSNHPPERGLVANVVSGTSSRENSFRSKPPPVVQHNSGWMAAQPRLTTELQALEENNGDGDDDSMSKDQAIVMEIIRKKEEERRIQESKSCLRRWWEKHRPVVQKWWLEIFYTGSMPNFQNYIYRRSFFHFDGAPVSTTKGTEYPSALRFFMTLYVGISIILRGVSQVYLCNHPITGICICIGLYMTSLRLLLYCIVGTAFSTFVGTLIALPHFTEVASGLIGYDGALVGCAVCTFIQPQDVLGDEANEFLAAINSRGMAIVLLLSTIAGIVRTSAANMNDLPALTLSFNIVVIFFLLFVGDGHSVLTELSWSAAPLITDDAVAVAAENAAAAAVSDSWVAFTAKFFYDAAIRGVGQFIFIPSTKGGWMVILGIFISNRWSAFAVILGSLTGALTARSILLVPRQALVSVRNGLYGYSAAGTCAAIGGNVFYRPGFFSVVVGLFSAAFTVFMQLGIEALLHTDRLQLPSLTMPFVATTWLMMLTRSAWLDPLAGEGEDFDDVLHRANKIEDMRVLQPEILADPTLLAGNITKTVQKKVMMRQESWRQRDSGVQSRRSSIVGAIKRIPSFSRTPSFNKTPKHAASSSP